MVIALGIPEPLREAFRFEPGQFLTLRARINGQDVRRNDSICRTRSRLTRCIAWALPQACRAKVIKGWVPVKKNFTLEPLELTPGFVLSGQARLTSERLVVRYDER